MTFNQDRQHVLRRMVELEKRATVVLVIRAIPSIAVWIGVFIWLFN